MRQERQAEVAEFQGFYGPFTVTEKLLQKIWLRGNFYTSGAKTTDGRSIEIFFPGKWNRLEGPDFKDARLRLGGRDLNGDVEIHFHAGDWFKHGHQLDPNYNEVVLHVLLFPPTENELPAKLLNGEQPPVLVLLDLLHHDLEEYAAEDAIESTLARSHWQATEILTSISQEERHRLLHEHAWQRWKQKVHFARLRLEKLGWSEACHQSALEILGYRRNRGAMLTVATRFPLSGWQKERPTEDELLATAHWIIRGARPANHPRQRLRQYLQMMETDPDWPERVEEVFRSIGNGSDREELGTRSARSDLNLKELREKVSKNLTGGFIGGTRLDTFVCDGLLPLLAARQEELEFFPAWFSWYAGDFPDRVIQTLRVAAITDGSVFVSCNGFCQGVIGLSLERKDDPLVCFESNESS